MADTDKIAGIGDNNPPAPIAPVLPGLKAAAAGPNDARPEDKPLSEAALSVETLVDPEILAQCRAKAAEFAAVWKQWSEVKEVESVAQSRLLADFITGATQVKKVVDRLRLDARAPHLERASKIQDYFLEVIETFEKAEKGAKGLLYAWQTKEKKRLEMERAEFLKRAAEQKARAEADLAAAKKAGDIAAEIEAEKAEAEATKQERIAAQPVKVATQSASGIGRAIAQKREIVVELTNLRLAFAHFQGRPELAEFLLNMARADARTAGVEQVAAKSFVVPGFNISIKE